jgi:hypothetical protein
VTTIVKSFASWEDRQVLSLKRLGGIAGFASAVAVLAAAGGAREAPLAFAAQQGDVFPSWQSRPTQVVAGAPATFVLSPGRSAECRVSTIGPLAHQWLRWAFTTRGVPIAITFSTRVDAAPGKWRIGAYCEIPGRRTRVLAAIVVKVVGRSGATGMLAHHSDVRVEALSASAKEPPIAVGGLPAAAVTVHQVGLSVNVDVHPRSPLHITVGTTSINAPAGTFARVGTIVVTQQVARIGKSYGLTPAGAGVDVRILHTTLRRPLTVTYRVGRPPRGTVPRVAHRMHNGNWELKAARLAPGGRLVLSTRSFSINLPSWLSPSSLWNDLTQWTKNVGNWVASGVGGRTAPLTCSGAPDWFSWQKQSELVHVCGITNAGRGEIQIKSNRGITLDVRVPGNPAYVWVERQPWSIRRLMPWLDPNHRVFLGPGETMTVGYDRPAETVDGTFSITGSSMGAYIDDGARAFLDFVANSRLGADSGVLLSYTWLQCGAGIDLNISTLASVDPAPSLGAFVACMMRSLVTLNDEPARAVSLVQQLGGDRATVDQLVQRAKAFSAIGRLIDAWPAVQATVSQALERALGIIGNDRISLHIDAVPHLPTTTTVTTTPVTTPTTTTAVTTPSPSVRVLAYDNYGPANAGHAMCRGNPSRPESMPGGTASQSFTVGSGVATVDEVTVQIDPDSTVTGHGSLYVNGALKASTDANAAGDTTFTFPRVPVAAGDQVKFSVTFSATFGKIITVYTAGNPGGEFIASNSCTDGAPSVSTTSTGLRAVVRGWSR